jgi:hypothetical protein
MGSTRPGQLSRFAAVAAAACGTFAATSCGKDDPPMCRLTTDKELAATSLTNLSNVRLDRAGSSFVLVGAEEGGNVVRFAALTPDGTLGAETAVPVPPHTAGPWYGLTGKTAPGDQLTVVYGTPNGSVAGKVELDVITMDAGGAGPSAPKPLVDGKGAPVVVETGVEDLRADMGSGQSGMLAGFTWGYNGQPASPQMVVLKADGAQTSPTDIRTLRDWDCLRISPSRTDFAVTTVHHPANSVLPTWYISESDGNGAIHFNLTVGLNTRDLTIEPNTNCPIVAPTSNGYTLAWQNTDGTYFGDINASVTSGEVPVNMHIVKGAVRWGGVQNQPPVVCVAFMKMDFAIAYASENGPQIDRFDIYGSAQGGSLFLPSHGRPGPVASWASVGSLYVTYLDLGDAGSKPKRYFIQVDCPPRT